jgi:hypothetical protein
MITSKMQNKVGAWRSLVAHWHGGPVVAGSNPVAPTKFLPSRTTPIVRCALVIAALACLIATGATLDPQQPMPRGGVCGSALILRSPETARDTVFTSRYSNARSDSGYDFVEVAEGDSLSLYLQWITDVNPHLRLWGPMTGINRATSRRLLRFHRLELQDRREIFESAIDVTTQGANSQISDISLTDLEASPEAITWQQAWRFIKNTGSSDTVAVVRTVRMGRSQPYFVIRYDFTWLGTRPGDVRLIWSCHPRIGREGSKHDVGFAPGYGLILAQRSFDAATLGYFAGAIDLGNPLAAYTDTVPGGASSFMAPALKVDFGSGRPEFPAAFVCFNPRQAIAPSEFAWMDSTGEGVASLDYDSPRIVLDTTRVLDGGFRTLLARTPAIEFTRGETKTLEYAVGRARLLGDRLPLVFPDVIWLDGSVSICPQTPNRR